MGLDTCVCLAALPSCRSKQPGSPSVSAGVWCQHSGGSVDTNTCCIQVQQAMIQSRAVSMFAHTSLCAPGTRCLLCSCGADFSPGLSAWPQALAVVSGCEGIAQCLASQQNQCVLCWGMVHWKTLWVNAGKALHRASGKQGKGASLSCVLLSRE